MGRDYSFRLSGLLVLSYSSMPCIDSFSSSERDAFCSALRFCWGSSSFWQPTARKATIAARLKTNLILLIFMVAVKVADSWGQVNPHSRGCCR